MIGRRLSKSNSTATYGAQVSRIQHPFAFGSSSVDMINQWHSQSQRRSSQDTFSGFDYEINGLSLFGAHAESHEVDSSAMKSPLDFPPIDPTRSKRPSEDDALSSLKSAHPFLEQTTTMPAFPSINDLMSVGMAEPPFAAKIQTSPPKIPRLSFLDKPPSNDSLQIRTITPSLLTPTSNANRKSPKFSRKLPSPIDTSVSYPKIQSESSQASPVSAGLDSETSLPSARPMSLISSPAAYQGPMFVTNTPCDDYAMKLAVCILDLGSSHASSSVAAAAVNAARSQTNSPLDHSVSVGPTIHSAHAVNNVATRILTTISTDLRNSAPTSAITPTQPLQPLSIRISSWAESFMLPPPRSAGVPTNAVPDDDTVDQLDKVTVKRLRNRISASRCRMKKRIWMNNMQKSNVALSKLALDIERYVKHLEAERDEMMRTLMDFQLQQQQQC